MDYYAEDKRLAAELETTLRKQLRLSRIKGGDLGTPKMQLKLQLLLRKLSVLAEPFRRLDDEIGAGGFSGANSFTMRASRSGVPIVVMRNGYHYMGQYSSQKPFAVQVQVGGGLRYGHKLALIAVAKAILQKFTYNTEYGASYVLEPEWGTNWCCVMLCVERKYDAQSDQSTAIFPLWA